MMDVGANMVGMVKINTKGLFKDTIENLTKDWQGSSYLVLNRNYVVPRDRQLIAIGYKYNTRKVLSFISAEDIGRIKAGIPCLSQYPDLFANVEICPLVCPLIMSKFFGPVY